MIRFGTITCTKQLQYIERSNNRLHLNYITHPKLSEHKWHTYGSLWRPAAQPALESEPARHTFAAPKRGQLRSQLTMRVPAPRCSCRLPTSASESPRTTANSWAHRSVPLRGAGYPNSSFRRAGPAGAPARRESDTLQPEGLVAAAAVARVPL